jgi:aspartate racemase
MKTIGLLGGVSWHSTLEYYRLINSFTNMKIGGAHAASILLYSFNYQEIKELQDKSEILLYNRLIKEARKLEKAGADCLLICANTLHMFYDQIQGNIHIPILHIADGVGQAIQKSGHGRVLLLGTAKTMEKPFYSERLEQYNIETVVPMSHERKTISDIIYDELVKGVVTKKSKEDYLTIINHAILSCSVEGVILGCTEIPLLISQADLDIKVFNSTEIHANQAVSFAMGE